MQSKRQTSKRNGLRNNGTHASERKQGHREDIGDSKCDPHFNKTKLKSETENESADFVETSSCHLGTIHNRNICQGVLDKFHYLKKKMELENVKGSKKDAKGRKKTCNSLNNDNDNAKEIPVETNEEKVDDDESDHCSSCTYDTRRHRTRNISERTNSRKRECSRKGSKQKRTSNEIETKESEKTFKVEQKRLFDKLKQAAKGDESSLYESDCETENKLSDKAIPLKGKVRRSKCSTKETKNISDNLLANASEVTNDKSIIESNIGSAGVEKCLYEGGKSDWREQLLLLEMSHNEFDDNVNIAEDHASDQMGESECTKIVRSAQSTDLNVDIKKKGRPKRMRNEAKDGKKGEGAQTVKSARNIKRGNSRAVVLDQKGNDMKDLSGQVRDIRKWKKAEKVNKSHAKCNETDDSTVDINRACIRLNFSDSAVSGPNQNDDCHTNCYEDFRLSLDSAVPCSVSTPRDKSKVEKTYLKKKTSKRKIRMVSNRKSNIKNNPLMTENVDDLIHEIPSLDISLPTPNPPRNDYNPFSLSYDEEKEDDDHSSDEDLPVGLTPLKIEKTLSENDIVWVKWKKWPHLPAMVRKVYKKKKRVTCAIFLPNGFLEDFTLGYSNQGSVIPYCDPKKDEILASTKDMPCDDQTFFRACCAEAEKFLTKEALKSLESTGVFKENITQEIDDEERDSCEESNASPCKKKRKLSDCVITKMENNCLSKQGQLRVEKMAKKTKPLTDFLISDTTKEYLEKIYSGIIGSDLHNKFLSGTIRERAKMKHRGFGPIDDDEQIELLLTTYLKWIKQINTKNIHEIHYVFDVWVPEAVVYALRKLKGYCPKRAWEKFNKGVRRTKEELQIMHNDMIDADKTDKQMSDKVVNFVLK